MFMIITKIKLIKVDDRYEIWTKSMGALIKVEEGVTRGLFGYMAGLNFDHLLMSQHELRTGI